MTSAFLTFNQHEARTAQAIFERLFPTESDSPGMPGATEIGVIDYVDRALAGACSDKLEWYRLGLSALDRAATKQHGNPFADCNPAEQDNLITCLEHGTLSDFSIPPQQAFFELLRSHLQEGLFSDPLYGGNRDKLGWKVLGHPGVWLENSAEENLTDQPVTKGGVIQSLSDLGFSLRQPTKSVEIPGYDPQRGALPPRDDADIVMVGVGAMGGIIAPVLAKAGLKVVAFEAGPWRTMHDYVPDELGATYYCRANMGPKFLSEVPRWCCNDGDPTQDATFSLGRMMNGVGGSVIHYGAWLRRFHPHHFRQRSYIRERWGENVLPENCTVADWPISYDDLEPYFTQLDYTVGIAGDAANPFLRRSKPYPMPPMRPFRLGEFFKAATTNMGLHPHPVPVGMNTVEYAGRPATTNTAWSNGFGSYASDKWDPSLSCIPESLTTGNFDLRTHCRVLRILTDGDGHARGVEYINANGERLIQNARTVILCAYTFENIRLMFLSGDTKHPGGLGNNTAQLGKYFMTKMFAHVDGYFPDIVFNRHTGPAAQGVVLDDFLSDEFDSVQHGFIGGATLGAEQQFLPIQISREALPADVPRWGKPYKHHLRNWQHYGVVRIQPDTLSYTTNFLDLDPHHRDKSGLGLPVLRITYDMRENEHKVSDWMEGKAEEILRAMGAVKTWRGPRFTGVGSSHDLGGARMGHDPATSVVDASLQVHDTPGLYVFGGAAFPTCPGINPTLTLWAMCWHAADRLVERLVIGNL